MAAWCAGWSVPGNVNDDAAPARATLTTLTVGIVSTAATRARACCVAIRGTGPAMVAPTSRIRMNAPPVTSRRFGIGRGVGAVSVALIDADLRHGRLDRSGTRADHGVENGNDN